jgi:carboxymethylenebutenolidase
MGSEMKETLVAKRVMLSTADGEMAVYDAEPDSEARSAIVVVQEAFGVNAHIEDVTRRVASAGYRAVSPHLFHRTGDPVFEYGDFEGLMPHMRALTNEGLLADLNATLGYLSDAGYQLPAVGIVGFCMGGSVAFLAAASYELGAAVTFYGGGITEGRFGMPPLVDLAHDLKTPWLGAFGDHDQGIPVEQVESLRQAVAAASVPTEIVRYPEAGHGFHCDRREDYHDDSAKDAWRRALEWFDRYLNRD